GYVEVSLTRPFDERQACLRVSDRGIGIRSEDLPRIFERFYRADKSRPRGQGGIGLGLSICQTIVASLDGEIHVESAPGKGSTFTVVLPLAPSQVSGPRDRKEVRSALG